MRIRAVRHNNRKKAFEVRLAGKTLAFFYAKSQPSPSGEDPVRRAFVDPEVGRERFTYELTSGPTGTVHIEQVLVRSAWSSRCPLGTALRPLRALGRRLR